MQNPLFEESWVDVGCPGSGQRILCICSVEDLRLKISDPREGADDDYVSHRDAARYAICVDEVVNYAPGCAVRMFAVSGQMASQEKANEAFRLP